MSKLKNHTGFEGMVDLMYTDTERIGTFQLLECDLHGTNLHLTDYSGSDNCIACVEDMVQASLPPKYKLPDYDEVMDGLNALVTPSNKKEDSNV